MLQDGRGETKQHTNEAFKVQLEYYKIFNANCFGTKNLKVVGHNLGIFPQFCPMEINSDHISKNAEHILGLLISCIFLVYKKNR